MLWRQGVEVVTNVAHDHLEVARHTLEAIATEKSGIVNPLTPSSWGPWPARRWRSFETGPPSVGHRSWHVTGMMTCWMPSRRVCRAVCRAGRGLWGAIPLRPRLVYRDEGRSRAGVSDVLRQRGVAPARGEEVLRTVRGNSSCRPVATRSRGRRRSW